MDVFIVGLDWKINFNDKKNDTNDEWGSPQYHNMKLFAAEYQDSKQVRHKTLKAAAELMTSAAADQSCASKHSFTYFCA